ncbi:glucosylglycerol hydrolase [Oscillatoria sp. CS-180]|uniref:glucosylglycerol hydrolase n=1 Tax=Oscillatoria sp. CS-180 TaxID=3021720 RepID=UPI002330D2EC|nr:glucosylglycerol hydrolase [Oscillatoria sp. CS-180]MDB9524685.1 glucosylglycerol hydrolase [Oscillatoria sp. CS-180]
MPVKSIRIPNICLVDDETQTLLNWASSVMASDDTYFDRGQRLAKRLGCHYRRDGLTEFGFWTPELTANVIQSERSLELEIFTPLVPIQFHEPRQTIEFQRDLVPVRQQGEFLWAVVSGVKAGNRTTAGAFYWLRYVDADQRVHIIRDPLAYSTPYGIFGPAEVYDMRRLQRRRADLSYFRRTAAPKGVADAEIPRVPTPTNILQIHVKTASPEGTLEGLTHQFKRVSEKIAAGETLTPADEVYAGYDAVQLLPVEPTIEYRREDTSGEHEFFAIQSLPVSSEAPASSKAENEQPAEKKVPVDGDGETVLEDVEGNEETALEKKEATLKDVTQADEAQKSTNSPHNAVLVTLRKPNTQNWGYDVPILASSATNPAVLGTLRPDETVDFIATLHNFAGGPIHLIYDLVYGHSDNQGLELLAQQFFKGPNMYGQDLNHQLPQVRAILLEMQRRKINTGADGVRVDGGQDFRFFNPLSGRVEQDDAYLLGMSDVVQNIQGYRRLMFTIFEDGRPWPEEGWEEKSTYRELVEMKPGSFQWGPLIFAHNTPTVKGFWDRKWRRVCEVIFQGDHWITGCGNHDTVRRGNQVETNADINWNLGKTLPQVLHRAYNNPATLLWVHGFSPGLPMDFLNATVETPWGFFRNTDDRYGVKVVSEEVGFLDWEIEPDMYADADAFLRLKALGFLEYEQLRDFAYALRDAMLETDYDLGAVAQICQHCLGDPDGIACEVPALEELNEEAHLPRFLATLDVPKLKTFAMAFMEDSHDMCNVGRYLEGLNSSITRFSLKLRQFRLSHPWLRENLTGRDRFNRISDDCRTIFYGYRSEPHPEGRPQEVVLMTHMGGQPMMVSPGDWLQLEMSAWRVALATPGLELRGDGHDLRSFELKDGEGVLLVPDR